MRLVSGALQQIEDVEQRPIGQDDDLVADRREVGVAGQDVAGRFPARPAVRGASKHNVAAEGVRVERVYVRVLAGEAAAVPHRVDIAGFRGVGGDRFFVVEVEWRAVLDQCRRLGPGVTAVGRLADQDSGCDKVRARGKRYLEDVTIGCDGDPGVRSSVVVATVGSGAARAGAEVCP